MIETWRITKTKYVDDALSGRGARMRGGRFNSEGTPLVYTAGSLSLAVLEVLAHLPSDRHLRQHRVVPVRFSEDLVEQLYQEDLPNDWRATPAPSSTQALGDAWVSSKRSLALRVPSAVVPAEPNYLINPLHPDVAEIDMGEARPLDIDPRLME